MLLPAAATTRDTSHDSGDQNTAGDSLEDAGDAIKPDAGDDILDAGEDILDPNDKDHAGAAGIRQTGMRTTPSPVEIPPWSDAVTKQSGRIGVSYGEKRNARPRHGRLSEGRRKFSQS